MARNTRAAIRDLWVSGTLGSFFFIATSTIPKFFSSVYPPTEWKASKPYLALRLGYALWLLAYFFISNLDNDAHPEPSWPDVLFDVLQSMASLLAAFALGFAAPSFGLVADAELQDALMYAHGAIGGLAFASLLFYCRKGAPKTVVWLRIACAVLAVAGLVADFGHSGHFFGFAILILVMLFVVLGVYAFNPARGIGTPPPSTVAATTAPAVEAKPPEDISTICAKEATDAHNAKVTREIKAKDAIDKADTRKRIAAAQLLFALSVIILIVGIAAVR